MTRRTILTASWDTEEGAGVNKVKTTKTDPGVKEDRVLEALIWSCGFSKGQAFIQAVDGRGRFTARFKPAAATTGVVCFVRFVREEVHMSVGVRVCVQRM